VLLLGAIGATGEWRHRTITSSLFAAPDRTRFMAAKLIAYAVAGAVLSVIVTLVVAAVGAVLLSATDAPVLGVGALLEGLWRNTLTAALLAAFGGAVGFAVRNQVVTIVGLLVMLFAVSPALVGLAPDVARFEPTFGAPVGIAEGDFGDTDALPTGLAVVVELAWIAGVAALGLFALRTRDVS